MRSKDLFRRLSDSSSLIRGDSHAFVQKTLGADTVFMLNESEKHTVKKTELKTALSKQNIHALVPVYGGEAATVVDQMLAHADKPVDMEAYILSYLFQVAGQTIAGGPVTLGGHVRKFQANMGTILSEASSPVRAVMARICGLFGHWASVGSRASIQDMFVIGKDLLMKGSRNPGNNLVKEMLRRYGLDPAKVDEKTDFPEELLYDISMTFAASIFTTSNMIMGTLNHYCRNPAELQELRVLMQVDYPGGTRDLKRLSVNPTLRKLWPAMVGNSAVDLVVRDVVKDLEFESDGENHTLRPGDLLVFDLASTQKTTMDGLQAKMGTLADNSPFLDALDARHNDVNSLFFEGRNQCPGRNMASSDAIPFALEVLSRIDMAPETPGQPPKPGLVTTHPHSTRFNIGTAGSRDIELHAQLQGVSLPVASTLVPAPDDRSGPASRPPDFLHGPVARPAANPLKH